MRKLRTYGLPLVTLLTLTLALSAALRDTAPPQVWTEVPSKVPAGEPFELHLSANEPSTFLVRYGELEVERVAQDLTISLLGLEGDNELLVTATDGSGNETLLEFVVHGVPALEPTLSAPADVASGDPLVARLGWNADSGGPADARLELAGAASRLVREEGELTLLAAAPLTHAPVTLSLKAQVVDEFGRELTLEREIAIRPSESAVQELNVPASTLSVITPQGRELERTTLEHAFARSDEVPLWVDSFEIPIEGRSTSGFAVARRYAPGGPVSYHEGSDIAAPVGTRIRATNSGRVLVADFFPIKGGMVVIDHGVGVTSLYFHLERILVEPGDEVMKGQTIGEVGSTGLSTGPHLHWEIRVAGEPTNPMAWVGRTWP